MDDADYQVPFRFTGTIDKLQIALDPPTLTEDDKKKLMEAGRAAHMRELSRGKIARSCSFGRDRVSLSEARFI